ncbi:MAG: primosomal protein N', partial [Candidatus Cloacimonas sp.]
GTVDILFVTQMIAKGLDFAQVTLVGVINADNSLNIPDFRASERSFQLLTQVAGRSGRGDKKGEVVIQTYNPEHYAIITANKQDFDSFVSQELENRKYLSYPPYTRIARIVFSHNDESFLMSELKKLTPLTKKVKSHFAKHPKSDQKKESSLNIGLLSGPSTFTILGPIAAPLPRLNNRYRYHIIIKSVSIKELSDSVNYLTENMNISRSIKVDIDIDPSSLL